MPTADGFPGEISREFGRDALSSIGCRCGMFLGTPPRRFFDAPRLIFDAPRLTNANRFGLGVLI